MLCLLCYLRRDPSWFTDCTCPPCFEVVDIYISLTNSIIVESTLLLPVLILPHRNRVFCYSREWYGFLLSRLMGQPTHSLLFFKTYALLNSTFVCLIGVIFGEKAEESNCLKVKTQQVLATDSETSQSKNAFGFVQVNAMWIPFYDVSVAKEK